MALKSIRIVNRDNSNDVGPGSPEFQATFVKDLAGSVVSEMLEQIKAGKVPAEWNGIELRQWFADKFADTRIKGTMDKRRMRDYRNVVITRNL